MSKAFCYVLCVVMCFFVEVQSAQASQLRNAVLKVFVTSNSMDYYRPWQSTGSAAKTGSAAVISGNKILTNAHVVSDHTFIQVRKDSNPKKYTAKLLAIGHDCDLALLTVDDPEFFEGITPLDLGKLPKLQDTVSVIGYPQGGDKLSITEGVVSRIEITPYVQSSRKLLTVQIDAAINSGNSGGPVIQDGKLVGIAMQGIAKSQNIGYMIPIPVVKHFFDDLNDGIYNGFPAMGIDINNTESKSLREYYKITDKEGGVLISNVLPNASGFGKLQHGDIVLKIDDVPIGVDGTFEFRGSERLSLIHLIAQKQVGDDIKIEYVRDGKLYKENIALKEYNRLIPQLNHYEKPPYYIYGGLVFTVLSADLLRSWGGKWWEKSPIDFLYYLMGAGRYNDDQNEVKVVLLQVLPDDINIGYHEVNNQVIKKIDGKKIDSLKDVVKILSKPTAKYTVIETLQNVNVIINNEDIDRITKEIISRNNIPFQYSDDVAEWLKE